MSEAWCNSSDTTSESGVTKLEDHLETENDLLDLTFDPASSTTPSLRPPKLNEAQLLAALELGFSGKYLPSSVTGGEGNNSTGTGRTSSNKLSQSASMINNTSHSNTTNNQGSGSQQNQYPLFVDNYSFDLSDEQLQGLLPALRRPDINQLPPDVLAVLLKSTRFEEILIPTQRRLAEVPPSPVISTQRPSSTDREHLDAALGTSTPPRSSSNNIATAPSEVSLPTDAKSALSPFAKEFVPSFQPKSTMNPQEQTAELTFAMSQVHVQGQNESFQGLLEDLDGADCILSTVTDMISQVSKDPASLNRCTKVTVDILKKYLNDEDTLGIVVTLLVEQMISNFNFCYSGARILETLRENKIGVGASTIKPLLLNRMHEEFTHCLNHMDDPNVRVRTLGVLRLLSELYMNFSVLPDKSKLHIFALAVLELMQKLIQKDNSVDSIKCVCQLLKLIGWEVENSDSKKVREYFDLVMKELSYIRMKSDGKLHPTCQTLVDMIFKLQSNKWDREQPDVTPASVPPEPMPSSRTPIYYEQPDSDDDYFDDAGIMIDDEPEDVQAAYEEFLKISSKK